MPVGAAIYWQDFSRMECSHGQPWQEVCSAGLCNIGWLLLITANLWSSPAGFITVLLMGQFFTGCGLGWGMLLVSEISYC